MSDELISNQFWVDATDIYLPVTEEWTNRVEVADLNGDNLLDLLFANGGNYSEPGELEASRVFINKGPDTKFEERTEQIFGDSKFISRVIKVRDINKDLIPDIIVGTTYESQSQLYLGIGNGATDEHKGLLSRVQSQLKKVKTNLQPILESTIPKLESDLKNAGAPWVEGQGLIKN